MACDISPVAMFFFFSSMQWFTKQNLLASIISLLSSVWLTWSLQVRFGLEDICRALTHQKLDFFLAQLWLWCETELARDAFDQTWLPILFLLHLLVPSRWWQLSGSGRDARMQLEDATHARSACADDHPTNQSRWTMDQNCLRPKTREVDSLGLACARRILKKFRLDGF